MKIRLLADYRGVLTDEVFYPAGDYDALPGADMPERHARALLQAGRATSKEKARRDSQKQARLSMSELRDLAKENNIAGYWNMKRATLEERLDGLLSDR